MKKDKYFRFTIKDDELNVDELTKAVNLPCDIYVKGEKTTFEYSKEVIYQETNRWVYYAASYEDNISIEKFFTEQLEVINKHLPILKKYINNYETQMEYTIYVVDETSTFNILLNKKTIKLLSKINAKFSLTFIDW